MSLNYPLGQKTDWHNESLWHVRQKRDGAVNVVREWETLRELASGIKEHTLSDLDNYLQEFETKAVQNGLEVMRANF